MCKTEATDYFASSVPEWDSLDQWMIKEVIRQWHACRHACIYLTRNSAIADKPRDAFVQMQRRG